MHEIVSYKDKPPDHIVHGLRCGEVEVKEMMQSDVSACEVKSERNNTQIIIGTAFVVQHKAQQCR